MRLPLDAGIVIALRRLTPTFKLSAESATEADSALKKGKGEARNEPASEPLPTNHLSRAHSDIFFSVECAKDVFNPTNLEFIDRQPFLMGQNHSKRNLKAPSLR